MEAHQKEQRGPAEEIDLIQARQRILEAMAEAGTGEEAKAIGGHGVLDLMAVMAERVAGSDALEPFARPEDLEAALGDVHGLVWRLRGALGRKIDPSTVPWDRIARAWKQSCEGDLIADAAILEIYARELKDHAEVVADDRQRWGEGAPPAPPGWYCQIRDLVRELASLGIHWTPQDDLVESKQGAGRINAKLMDRMRDLLVRLRTWYFQAADEAETQEFMDQARALARKWYTEAEDHDYRKMRDGAMELERIALRAELLGHALPEPVAVLTLEVTGEEPCEVTVLELGIEPAPIVVSSAARAYACLWKLYMVIAVRQDRFKPRNLR